MSFLERFPEARLPSGRIWAAPTRSKFYEIVTGSVTPTRWQQSRSGAMRGAFFPRREENVGQSDVPADILPRRVPANVKQGPWTSEDFDNSLLDSAKRWNESTGRKSIVVPGDIISHFMKSIAVPEGEFGDDEKTAAFDAVLAEIKKDKQKWALVKSIGYDDLLVAEWTSSRYGSMVFIGRRGGLGQATVDPPELLKKVKIIVLRNQSIKNIKSSALLFSEFYAPFTVFVAMLMAEVQGDWDTEYLSPGPEFPIWDNIHEDAVQGTYGINALTFSRIIDMLVAGGTMQPIEAVFRTGAHIPLFQRYYPLRRQTLFEAIHGKVTPN